MEEKYFKQLFRYLFPFLMFSVFSGIEYIVNDELKSIIYTFKIFSILLLFLVLFKNYLNEIEGNFDIVSILPGILVLIIWLVKESFYHSTGYKSSVLSESFMITSLYMNFIGPVIAIPLLEEVFFRSFLMRFLVNSDFLSVKLGTYTNFSFFLSALVFALVHDRGEWIVAFIAGIIYGAYLVKTKNLKGCILAHSITNLGLFINSIIR